MAKSEPAPVSSAASREEAAGSSKPEPSQSPSPSKSEPRSKSAGTKSSGAKSTGAKSTGAKSTAAKSSGAKSSGATPSDAGVPGLAKNPLGEPIAAVVTLLVGAPLFALFAIALVHGQQRASEAPLEAILGIEAYNDLRAGETDRFHYLAPLDPAARLRAPDFTLRDRHGRNWSMSERRGKTVIMNFWSITCPPCLEEMPSLMELGRLVQHRDDIEVVTISTDQGWSEVAPVFARTGPDLPFTLLFDPDKAVTRDKFGTRLYPETWIIDADGVIQLRYDGPRDWSAPLVVELLDRYSKS